jgi:hypothetical protein
VSIRPAVDFAREDPLHEVKVQPPVHGRISRFGRGTGDAVVNAIVFGNWGLRSYEPALIFQQVTGDD